MNTPDIPLAASLLMWVLLIYLGACVLVLLWLALKMALRRLRKLLTSAHEQLKR